MVECEWTKFCHEEATDTGLFGDPDSGEKMMMYNFCHDHYLEFIKFVREESNKQNKPFIEIENDGRW